MEESNQNLNICYIANPLDNHDCKWINRFADRYHVHLICSPYSKEAKSYIENDSIQIHEIIPALFPYKSPLEIRRVKKELQAFMKAHRIDIIHSMYAYPNSIYAYLSGHKNHLITTRGSDVLVDFRILNNPKSFNQFFVYPLLRYFFQKAFKKASYITSTSLSQKDVVSQISSDPDKNLVVRTGIDTQSIDGYSDKVFVGDDNDLIIFSARSMKPIYNIELILEGIFLFTRNSNRSVRLKIIDDEPHSEYSRMIREKIKNSKFEENVQILPSLSVKEMIEHYLHSDLVIMAPKSDGTPNTALESMYLKRPLILGAIKYDDDIFNDTTVWKIEKDSAESINDKISELLSESEETVSTKLEQAKKVVEEKATLLSAVAKVDSLYHKIALK